jgi:hypothetical protein
VGASFAGIDLLSKSVRLIPVFGNTKVKKVFLVRSIFEKRTFLNI